MIRIAFGGWLVLAGTGLAPEIWSGDWWAVVIGSVIVASGVEHALSRHGQGGDS